MATVVDEKMAVPVQNHRTVRLPNMDNVAAVATQMGNSERARVADGIREAGSPQMPWVDGQWPPMDQIIRISLEPSQWTFALESVRKSAKRNERAGRETSRRLCQNIISAIEPLL